MVDLECIKLADAPDIETSNFVWLNDHEIAVATFASRWAEIKQQEHGIKVYNIITDEWRLHIPYLQRNIQEHSISYDTATKILWLYTDKSDLINFNMDTKEITIVKSDARKVGFIPRILLIEDKLHSILGSTCKDHLMWNDKEQKFQTLYTFPDMTDGLHGHQIIYVKSKGLLYLFGGYDEGAEDMDEGANKYIWRCDINYHYKWTKLATNIYDTFDTELYYSACVLTPDEKSVVIFDGDKIYLFDIGTETLSDTGMKLKCNEWNYTPNYAILCGGERDDVLINGYVRLITNELEIMVPEELVGVLKQFYSTQMVYLLQRYGKSFFKVSLDKIFNK